jgi:hypothetical protein
MSTTISSSRRREVALGDFTGLAAADAIARLRALEMRPAVEGVEADEAGQHGLVLAHEPAATSVVRRAAEYGATLTGWASSWAIRSHDDTAPGSLENARDRRNACAAALVLQTRSYAFRSARAKNESTYS